MYKQARKYAQPCIFSVTGHEAIIDVSNFLLPLGNSLFPLCLASVLVD